jgi:translation initiation factor eIF-2B subunit alpha
MFELVQALNQGAQSLRNRFTNSISLNAGCELFIAFVTLFPHEHDVRPCIRHLLLKRPYTNITIPELPRSKSGARKARPKICTGGTLLSRKNRRLGLRFHQRWLGRTYIMLRLAKSKCESLINVCSKILTHSYSRVVMQALLLAHKRKRISVYVTEARPRGLGYICIVIKLSLRRN